MGSLAHGLDLARPFAVDGFRLRAGRPTASSTARWWWPSRLAEVLVQGGERVGIPGLMRPTASRNVIEKMAQAIVHDPANAPSLPPSFAPSPLSEIVLLSDLWSPIAEVQQTIGQLSATGAHGHVVQIVDPAEESFPYSGRVEFIEPEGAGSVTAGRAETWRNDYQGLVARHRAAHPRRDRPARLELRHPPHRPAGRANCCLRCMRAWAPVCRRRP